MAIRVFEKRNLTRVFVERNNFDNMLHASNYQSLVENNNNTLESVTKNNGITPYSFAKILLSKYLFIKINSVVHFYNDIFGFYQPLTFANGDLLIRHITPPNLCYWVSSYNIKETISWLNSLVDKEASPEAMGFTSCRHLNFMDGYLDIIDGIFHKHSPNMIFTSYIPFNYSECRLKTHTPVFDNWLEEVTNHNKNMEVLLAQILGYLISEYRNIKYIFMLYGPSDSGKSVWLKLFRTAIGDNFVKSISLHNLTANFRTAELLGMKANICAETDQRKLTNIDIVKSLVGGSDKINADVKNSKPIEFVNTAALIFSTNTLEWIRVADPGGALANRIRIVVFEKEVKKIENNFFNKLLKELPGIIYKFAIPGFGYLATNDFHFTFDAATNYLKGSAQEITNIAVSFLAEACIFNGTAQIHTDRLYTAYINYCDKHKCSALRKLDFKDLLNNLHHHLDIAPLTYCEKFRDKGFNRNGFFGINLKDDFKIRDFE